MTDPDDQHAPRPSASDQDGGFSGEEYDITQEKRPGKAMPAGSVNRSPPVPADDDAAMPPDNGRRASFDPATGEVHGSGAGAGGGNAGEDADSDSASGDGPGLTGAGSRPRGR